jgi:Flp pilus assembly protein protease CpaA
MGRPFVLKASTPLASLLEWLPGLLVSASMLMAAYMDVRMRAVYDWVWLPGIAGAIALYTLNLHLWPLLTLRLAVLGLTGYWMARLGMLGDGDAIALAFLAVTPDPRAPLREGMFAAVLTAAHLGYLWRRGWVGRKILVPMEVFLREPRWIPRRILAGDGAIPLPGDVNAARDEVERFVRGRGAGPGGLQVEVEYGVPTASYLGLGYFAAYLLYILGL